MSKYFLGSVGIAEAFYVNKGTKRLAFVARTLTEHAINISATQDELRAGTGSVTQAVFSHDPNIEIKLVDVLWNSEYVETILGKKFKGGGQVTDYCSETVVSSGSDNLTYLSYAPVSLPFSTYSYPDENSALTATITFPLFRMIESKIMLNRVGTEEWTWYTGQISGNGIYLPAGSWNVYYLYSSESARELWVDANLCPAELYLVITAPLYKADGCGQDVSEGSELGHLTFEIPRFKIRSDLNLNFQMSSQTSIEISGIALATEDCCRDTLKMMRIVEVRDDYDFTDEIDAIIISGE